MDLSIIGSGYVGLVTGACFADVGHHVICVDNDPRKVESLQAGKVPIYEPGLEEVVHRNVAAQRLRFTDSIEDGVDHSQIVFIAVPTPPQPDGSVDLSFIEKVAREIAGVLTELSRDRGQEHGAGEDRRKGRATRSSAITSTARSSTSSAIRNSCAKAAPWPI